MDLLLFENASFVLIFVKQHATQHAKTMSSFEFNRILFHATNSPTIPLKMSPSPPHLLRPPSSSQHNLLRKTPLLLLLLLLPLDLEINWIISSWNPFRTIITPSNLCSKISSDPSPSVATKRLYSTELGVNTMVVLFVAAAAAPPPPDSKSRFCSNVNRNKASASKTRPNPRFFASRIMSAVALITRGHLPNPGPITRACMFGMTSVT
mmetsp:Transcript_12819/g.18282  ORF Transcript_12819/g.18282 Transcript_12819/m.18282 type:complete len:208 (+) Transcript_12819:172-795(+)